MTGCCILMTTTDSLDRAQKITQGLITTDLAKCVQFHKIKSIYKWDGKIIEAEEYKLSIKTEIKNVKAIEEHILAEHDYDMPEIVQVNIDGGFKPYLDWLKGL